MRMSQMFGRTLREAPADAEIASHQLLARAGFIRPMAAGIYSYLPLARRTLDKIEKIIREELNAIGGQEVTMPVVQPASFWQQSGRWYRIGAEMGRFKDRIGRDMVLAMTHEEVVADLARQEIHSYRQLPRLMYQIQAKWYDDPHPRDGLVRVREFVGLESYSLDRDEEGLEAHYRALYQAYLKVFNRCGLPVLVVQSDVGQTGGQAAHAFIYPTQMGDDTAMLCSTCGFAANRKIAPFRKTLPLEEPLLPTELVLTPDCKTIEDLANFLSIPKAKTAKAVFLVATLREQGKELERVVFAVLRGDMELSETKLANLIGAVALRPATEEEISSTGAVPGYASPIGVTQALVVVDDALLHSPNLVAGANRQGYHLRNVNFPRDFEADFVADIAAAQEGDACITCESGLRLMRGLVVGDMFKLGTRFSEALGCAYLDVDGQPKVVVMGAYGINCSRLLACIAEEHHDEHGLMWPMSVAPYQVHLILLKGTDAFDSAQVAEKLYLELTANGVEVLFDDRQESPGVKFNDADLIGLPLRLTVSQRSLAENGVEFKPRHLPAREIVPLDSLVQRVLEVRQDKLNELSTRAREGFALQPNELLKPDSHEG